MTITVTGKFENAEEVEALHTDKFPGYKAHDRSAGIYKNYWIMYRPFLILALDSHDYPSVVRDLTTERVYKVNVDHEQMHPEHGISIYNLKITGEHSEVKNLNIKTALAWYINHKSVWVKDWTEKKDS